MKVLTDTREQLPLFKDSRRCTLKVGDYTTVKLKDKFHIERKSLQDLYGTVTSGNRRFKYMLFAAAWHRISICVFVEGTREQFLNKDFPKGNERKIKRETLEKLLKTFEKKYHLCFHFFDDRATARKAVYQRLSEEEFNYANAVYSLGLNSGAVKSAKTVQKRYKTNQK